MAVSEEEVAPMPPRASVLIVDDDPATLAALPTTLSIHLPDVSVSTCVSGLLGLERLRAMDFGVILADLRMPGMDGLTFLHKVHEVRRHTAVVMMSGVTEWGIAKRALEAGAFAYVQKPINRGLLTQAVRLALHCREMRDRVKFGKRRLDRLSAVLRRAQSLPAPSEVFKVALTRTAEGHRRGTASIVQIERVIASVTHHLRSHNETLRMLEGEAQAEAKCLLDALGE